MVREDNQVVIEMIETIADNKFIMGDHLVEIGVSGPNLEATLASIALAQSELGHARLLYNWSYELKNEGVKGKKPEIENQTGKAFPTTINVNDWTSLIARLYTTNVASEIILDVIAASSFTEKMIVKMIQEQKENLVYAESWCNQLINDEGQIPVKFEEDFNDSAKDALDWLRTWQNDDRLVHLRITDSEKDFEDLFNNRIENVSKIQTTVQSK